MACTLDLNSVPSSSYPVWQSFTKRAEIHRVFQSMCNRIRWKWYFRDKEKLNLSVIVPRKGNASQCTHPVSPALESWPSSLRFSSSREFAKCHKVASKDPPSSSKTPLVYFGSEFLASSNVAAAANDEDGILLQLLDTGPCVEADWSNWDMRFLKEAAAYINLTTRVE